MSISSHLSQIQESQIQLKSALKTISPDDVLISGILNFVRSKFVTLILKDINGSISKYQNEFLEDEIKLAQNSPSSNEETAEVMLDRIWDDFYHPVLKYYQSQFQSLKNEESKYRKRSVELNKLFTKLQKITKISSDFFKDILKQILAQYDLRFKIPSMFYDLLQLEPSVTSLKINHNDSTTVVKLVYLIHRSLLFQGVISRYRTKASHYLSKSYHEKYDKALKYCRYSELLLPSFGDARNFIGMIYDSLDDKLLALNEFARSSLSRIPSNFALSNFKTVLKSKESVIDELNQLRIQNKINSQKRYKYISIHFLSLFGYYFAFDKWSRSSGVLSNGVKIDELETDFFQNLKTFLKQNEETYENFTIDRLIILLISGITINFQDSIDITDALKFLFKFSSFLINNIIEQWESNFDNIIRSITALRILLTWIKINKLANQYSLRDFEFCFSLATLTNLIIDKYPSEEFIKPPVRNQYFNEDVGVREFTPINRILWDFDDTHIFHDSENLDIKCMGQFESHNSEVETPLRIFAIATISKKILINNRIGIEFDGVQKLFLLDKAKPLKKKKKSKPDLGKDKPQAPVKSQLKNSKGKTQYQKAKVKETKTSNKKPTKQHKSKKFVKPPSNSPSQEEIIMIDSSQLSESQSVQSKTINSAPSIEPKVLTVDELEAQLISSVPQTHISNGHGNEEFKMVNMVDSLVNDSFFSNASNQSHQVAPDYVTPPTTTTNQWSNPGNVSMDDYYKAYQSYYQSAFANNPQAQQYYQQYFNQLSNNLKNNQEQSNNNSTPVSNFYQYQTQVPLDPINLSSNGSYNYQQINGSPQQNSAYRQYLPNQNQNNNGYGNKQFNGHLYPYDQLNND
ncbi:hypothetical protein WICMUC_004696 [Wickerhamomyces mucosus]|uniref:Protein EBS1 n=1 Tax=Wickerhamomyces mucosus TaxID=1378264 RepID=A0A9P8PHL2_9ASCO|nr:hypothetical protein WICMUC_004696 [Wickerhamomyces mucosus]